jgi:3-dehydroquinate dehydratase-2
VLHGPNLSRLGKREPAVYGTTTLAEVNARLVELGAQLGAVVTTLQSNHEGVLVDRILGAVEDGEGRADAIVMNAGAYAHTSLAIADAVRSVAPLPVVEVHLSNTVAREAFRHVALLGAAAKGRIEGFGPLSYELGLRAVLELLDRADH